MKIITLCSALVLATLCTALQVNPFGPSVDSFTCANLQQIPLSFGAVLNGHHCLFVEIAGEWQHFDTQNLPVKSIYVQSSTYLLVAMGDGTDSDGLYGFNLDSQQWNLVQWFSEPNFITFNPANSLYYLGDSSGLYQSDNGTLWQHINLMGNAVCSSIDFYDNYLVANCGTQVFCSADNGVNWSLTNGVNLTDFHYTAETYLFGIMNVGSDSDGIWCSADFGQSWFACHYCSCVCELGPDFNGCLTIGRSESDVPAQYVALYHPGEQICFCNHVYLDSPVLQMDVFPWVNTPSFYVLNGQGCFFITDFLTDNDDALIPELLRPNLSVYPNPAFSYASLKIAGKLRGNEALSLYNLKGQLIRAIPVSNDVSGLERISSLDLADLPAGIYLLCLRDANARKLASHKVVHLK